MTRSRVMIALWLLVTAGWGYAATAAVTAAGRSAVLAAASLIVPVTIFAWTRRQLEIRDVVMPALGASYLGYIGFAIARAPCARASVPHVLGKRWFGPFGDLGPLAEQWPLLLVAGITFAAAITVVAVPLSMVPSMRGKFDPHRDEDLWKFVESRNRTNGGDRR